MATENTDGDGGDTHLSKDDMHHLLSSRRRRLVIAILDEHGPLSKSDLATEIARIEAEDSEGESIGKVRKRVYVSLHQAHLEPLEDHGVIVIVDGDVIHTGPNAEQLLPHIDEVPSLRRWAASAKRSILGD